MVLLKRRAQILALLIALSVAFSVLLAATAQEPNQEKTLPSGRTSESDQERASDEMSRYLVRQLGLEEIPSQKGGGYSCFTRFGRGDEAALARLPELPNVRAFTFDDEFTPKGWQQLGRLAELQHLECSSTRITDEDLGCLQQLPQLEKLVLESHSGELNPFTDRSLEPLRRMQRLRRLVLHSRGITDLGLGHVGTVESLVSLEIVGRFSNEGVQHLRKLKKLEYLVLDGHFDDEALVHLAGLENLKALSLKSDNLTGNGLSHLASLKQLEVLKFAGSPNTKTTLASLGQWPALEALNLADPRTNDSLLATLGELGSLKSLALEGAAITDNGMVALASLKNLEELDVQNTRISGRGLQHLLPLKNLRTLIIGSVYQEKLIAEKELEMLSKLPRLERLGINYVDLQGDKLGHLAEIPSLKYVNVTVTNRQVLQGWQQLRAARAELQRADERIVVGASQPDLPSFGNIDVISEEDMQAGSGRARE